MDILGIKLPLLKNKYQVYDKRFGISYNLTTFMFIYIFVITMN